MKKKVLIITLIVFILLMCSMIIIFKSNYPKDDSVFLAEENIVTQNTIDTATTNATFDEDEIKPESNTTIPEMEIEIKKENSKEDKSVVEKSVSKASTFSTTNINKDTTSINQNTQNNQTNNSESSKNTETKSTTSSSNVENSKSKETTTTKPVEKTTETQPVTQPTRCTHNNNHGMDVGNSGKWFNTKAEAITFYEEKINYWGRLWENYEIEDDEYYKNCPTGYEYYSCMYCSKWTINLYYR